MAGADIGARELAGDIVLQDPADLDDIVKHAIIGVGGVRDRRAVADVDRNDSLAVGIHVAPKDA